MKVIIESEQFNRTLKRMTHEIIERNEQDEFLTYFPEYKEYFIEINNAYTHYINNLTNIIKDVNKVIENNPGWSKKDFAIYIKNNYPEYSSFIFNFIKTDLIKLFVEVEWKKLTKDSKMKKLGFKLIDESNV